MPQASSLLTLGVDLGGTKVEVGLVDERGQIVRSHRYTTEPEKGADSVIAEIPGRVEALLRQAGHSAQAMGIGVAGQVDKSTGMVFFAPNLEWRDVPLGARLREALGIPVVVTNDVRAATWGEWRYGAGRGVSDLVCLFVGTGVGGGVVAGGRVIEGFHNAAGELGHMTIVAGGRPCRCPNRGCLEAYAGGWAIAERAQEAAGADPPAGKTLVALAGGLQQISAATVSKAYAQDDPMARRLVDETAHYLAAGVVGIVNALNPHLFVLGGGIIDGIPDLASAIEPTVRTQALEAAVARLRIVTAELGSKAGVIGAAALAQSIKVEPGGENG